MNTLNIQATDYSNAKKILSEHWALLMDCNGTEASELKVALENIPTVQNNLEYVDWGDFLTTKLAHIIQHQLLGIFKETQPFLFEHLASNGFWERMVMEFGTDYITSKELNENQAYIPEIKKHYPNLDLNTLFLYGAPIDKSNVFLGEFFDEGLMGIAIMGERAEFIKVLLAHGAELYNKNDLNTPNIFRYVNETTCLKIILAHDSEAFIKAQYFETLMEGGSPVINLKNFNPDDYINNGSFQSIRPSLLWEVYPIIERTLPENINLTQWHFNTIIHYEFTDKLNSTRIEESSKVKKYLCAVIQERPEILEYKTPKHVNTFPALNESTLEQWLNNGKYPDISEFIEKVKKEKLLVKKLEENTKLQIKPRF